MRGPAAKSNDAFLRPYCPCSDKVTVPISPETVFLSAPKLPDIGPMTCGNAVEPINYTCRCPAPFSKLVAGKEPIAVVAKR